MSDAIVEEVRKARDEFARRFNYDLHAMCADLRREQELSGAKVVSFPRRPVRVRPADKGVRQTGDAKADSQGATSLEAAPFEALQ